MEVLLPVTQEASFSFDIDSDLKETDFSNKKISRLMLDLFETLMPILQSLNTASREFGVYSFNCFKETSGVESGQQKNLALVALTGISAAAPISKEFKDAVSAVSSSGNAFFQSRLTDATTTKNINQDLFSRTHQDQSTLLSVIDKLLQLVNQVVQTEKSSG